MTDLRGEPPLDGSEVLLRRILADDQYLMPDAATGRVLPTRAALQFPPGPSDGMSVQVESLLCFTECTRSNIYDWTTCHGIEFPAEAPYAGGGHAVAAPDPKDHRLGAAHGVVLTRDDGPSKAAKSAVRTQILARFTWMQEDPNSPR